MHTAGAEQQILREPKTCVEFLSHSFSRQDFTGAEIRRNSQLLTAGISLCKYAVWIIDQREPQWKFTVISAGCWAPFFFSSEGGSSHLVFTHQLSTGLWRQRIWCIAELVLSTAIPPPREEVLGMPLTRPTHESGDGAAKQWAETCWKASSKAADYFHMLSLCHLVHCYCRNIDYIL